MSTWSDQSGNGLNVTQATAAVQPTISSIHGRTAVKFLGSSSQRLAPISANDGTKWPFMDDGFTFAAVVDFSANGNGTIFSTANTNADTGALVDRNSGNLRNFVYDAGGTNDLAVSVAITAALHDIVVVVDSALTPDATVYVDGVSVATGNFARAAPSGNTTHGSWVGSNGAVGNLLTATIGEILIYDNALSTADVASLRAYLKAFWKL